MRRRLHDLHEDDRGFATTMWMLGISLLILIVGLMVFDAYRVLAERRTMANVVDTAVIDAASLVDYQSVYSTGVLNGESQTVNLLPDAHLRAEEQVEAAGYTVLNGPPLTFTSGRSVTVTATTQVQLIFMRILRPTTPYVNLQVSATADGFVQIDNTAQPE